MIERLHTHPVHTTAYLTVFDDTVRLPDGRTGRYTRARAGDGHPGVVVLPLRRRHVAVVRQHRYPHGASLWELPRGFAASDDPRHDAARELAEETGLRVDPRDLTDLGWVYPDSGLLETRVAAFAAHIADNAALTPGDETDRAAWVHHDRLAELVAGGDLRDGFTLAAVARAAARGLLSLHRPT